MYEISIWGPPPHDILGSISSTPTPHIRTRRTEDTKSTLADTPLLSLRPLMEEYLLEVTPCAGLWCVAISEGTAKWLGIFMITKQDGKWIIADHLDSESSTRVTHWPPRT